MTTIIPIDGHWDWPLAPFAWVALSTEHGFPLFFGYATVIRGWSLTMLGHAQEGLTMLKQGLLAIRPTGAVAGTPIALIRLAEAHAILGQSVEGLNCLAEAATTSPTLGELEFCRGRHEFVREHFRTALAPARSPLERRFLHRRVDARERCDKQKWPTNSSIAAKRLR